MHTAQAMSLGYTCDNHFYDHAKISCAVIQWSLKVLLHMALDRITIWSLFLVKLVID